jgi:hypothetical protein
VFFPFRLQFNASAAGDVAALGAALQNTTVSLLLRQQVAFVFGTTASRLVIIAYLIGGPVQTTVMFGWLDPVNRNLRASADRGAGVSDFDFESGNVGSDQNHVVEERILLEAARQLGGSPTVTLSPSGTVTPVTRSNTASASVSPSPSASYNDTGPYERAPPSDYVAGVPYLPSGVTVAMAVYFPVTSTSDTQDSLNSQVRSAWMRSFSLDSM